MAQYVALRSLSRNGPSVRVVDKDGNKVKLSSTTDTIIDLDNVANRQALAHHSAIGQWIVTATNARTGANVALPSDT